MKLDTTHEDYFEHKEKYYKLRNNLISLIYINLIIVDISWVFYLFSQ